MALFSFVIFIAVNGLLSQWLALFTFSTPLVVQPGSGAGGGTSLPAQVDNAVGSAIAAGPLSIASSGLKTGQAIGSFLGGF